MDGLKKVVYPNGEYVEYAYDDSCRLTSVKTLYGTTSYEYDKLDRLVRVVDRNGYATVYEYDENGNRSAVKYTNGIVVSYDYDEVNRLISEKALDKQGGLVAQYEYTLGAAGERELDIIKIQDTWANYLKIAVAGYVAGFGLLFVAINRSDTLVTVASLIFTLSLISSSVLLGKICATGLVDSVLFSAEECKEYTVGTHAFYWFLAGLFLPLLVYGIYKILKNANNLDTDTYRSENEVKLSELSRRSFELQKEIESLKAELNS